MSAWYAMGMLILFLLFPGIVKEGMQIGLEKGLFVLMPALFPYMVVSQLVIKTGAAQHICRMLPKKNLNPHLLELLLPSLFCGYPTGARLASMAYNEHRTITKQELRLMYAFGNIPGCGFCISFLGGVLYSDYILGVKMYLSYLLASVMLCSMGSRFQKELLCKRESSAKNPIFLPFTRAFTQSVSESAMAMVSLICFVCFFSCVISLVCAVGHNAVFSGVAAAFLEITTGLQLISQIAGKYAVVFFGGFSGICVMFQSLFFDKENAVNLLHLLGYRIIYGIGSMICFYGICLLTGGI